MPEELKPLYMKVSLGTIDDLGVKLYSGFPAAIAELVANAWDADAEQVDIITPNGKIIIQDNGHGMNRDDIQNKYLTVGYRRREHGEKETPKHKRKVMGRKGIGRLALFAIANRIKVYSVKNGEKIGLELSYPEIKKAIQNRTDYYPKEIESNEIEITRGTRIELTEFRYQPRGLSARLKERLARRFSIIGEKYHFKVFIDKEGISASDRNYYSKIQYLWTFGNEEKSMTIKNLCTKVEDYKHFENTNEGLSGWIGSVFHHGELKGDDVSLNNIAIMMRGRLAQEDILHSLGQGELAEKYLVGEIHADYLDEDEEEDIATSGRQRLNENDTRYNEVKQEIQKLVQPICQEWKGKRGKKAKEDILNKNEELKDWYNKLLPDAQRVTDRLFKDIASIQDRDKDKEKERKQNLICCIILAVEQMSMRGNLDKLQEVSLEDLGKFSNLFNYQDDFEAMNYYTITQGRLSVINKLAEHVQDEVLEKIIQKHIYDHLWLLDPSWEPPCTEKHIEERVVKKWKSMNSKDNGEEIKNLRIDIRYRKTSGRHVVIELKKPGRQFQSYLKLQEQIKDYMEAVSDILKNQSDNSVVEGVIIVGDLPQDLKGTNKTNYIDSLAQVRIKITTYDEIISQAKKQYKEYLEEQEKAKNKIQMIQNIMEQIRRDE